MNNDLKKGDFVILKSRNISSSWIRVICEVVTIRRSPKGDVDYVSIKIVNTSLSTDKNYPKDGYTATVLYHQCLKIPDTILTIEARVLFVAMIPRDRIVTDDK